jgi:RNA recognition motif-containing protein
MFRGLQFLPSLAQRANLFSNNGTILNIARTFSSGSRTVFVRNLNEDTQKEDLIEFFRRCGDVESAYLPEEFGRIKGFGFITYKDSEACSRALRDLNGQNFNGNSLTVLLKKEDPVDEKKIYLRNLPEDLTEEDLRNKLSDENVQIRSINLRSTDDNRQFAFVEFEEKDDCDKIKALRQFSFNGEEIPILECRQRQKKVNGFSQSSGQDDGNSALFVTNIASGSSFVDVKEHFNTIAKVKFVHLLTDKFTGESNGKAIVNFFNEKDALQALRSLNNSTINGNVVSVSQFRQRAPKTDFF